MLECDVDGVVQRILSNCFDWPCSTFDRDICVRVFVLTYGLNGRLISSNLVLFIPSYCRAPGGTHDLSQLQQIIPTAAAAPNAAQQAVSSPQATSTRSTAPAPTNTSTAVATLAVANAAAVAAAQQAAAPGAPAPAVVQAGNTPNTNSTSMNPPPRPGSQSALVLPSALSNAGIATSSQKLPAHANIAPMPGGKILPTSTPSDVVTVSSQGSVSSSGNTGSGVGSGGGSIPMVMDDKKQMKRAANRRSAQLSRKRKKQFIEELKEENDDLRRKELILKSIPDMIVVFDSSGKLGFVSESVSRFIDMTPDELEGTSFWNRLCEDSVRLLKAAFMDSLAARKPDSDTAPLGSGVWELRLVDKDSSHLVVSLNGVVHFSGEAPECVCCIRPRDMQPIQKLPKERATKAAKVAARAVSSSDGSRSSDNSGDDELQIRAKPSQSVMGNNDSTSTDVSVETSAKRLVERKPAGRRSNGEDVRIAMGNDGQLIRISDGDSGCEISESGSDD